MASQLNNEQITELKKLLENGTPLQQAISKIDKTNGELTIEGIGDIQVKSNTVGGCSIGSQYCGCEYWK